MNLSTVKAAIASPKTPASLKRGLIKKYGDKLGKVSMSALATTIKPNPAKRKNPNTSAKARAGVVRYNNEKAILQKYVDKVFKLMEATGEGMTFVEMGHTAKRLAKTAKDRRIIQDNWMTFMEMCRKEGVKRGWGNFRS